MREIVHIQARTAAGLAPPPGGRRSHPCNPGRMLGAPAARGSPELSVRAVSCPQGGRPRQRRSPAAVPSLMQGGQCGCVRPRRRDRGGAWLPRHRLPCAAALLGLPANCRCLSALPAPPAPPRAATRSVPSSGRCAGSRGQCWAAAAAAATSCPPPRRLLTAHLFRVSPTLALQVVCDEHGVDPTGTVRAAAVSTWDASRATARSCTVPWHATPCC